MDTLPKVGQKVIAEYVIDGKIRKVLNLGKVVKATTKSFICEKDGLKTERNYSFGASNGVRLKGFEDDSEEKGSEEKTEEKKTTKSTTRKKK